MFESYSSLNLNRTIQALKILDDRINEDLITHPVPDLPSDHEWQITSFRSVFSKSRKDAAFKRVAFNAGVISEICKHYFDGQPKHLDKFCKKAISSLPHGSKLLKGFKDASKHSSVEFLNGESWGTGFINRHLKETSHKSAEPEKRLTEDIKNGEFEAINSQTVHVEDKYFFDHYKELSTKTREQRHEFYKELVHQEEQQFLKMSEIKTSFNELEKGQLQYKETYDKWLPKFDAENQFFGKQLIKTVKVLNNLGFNFFCDLMAISDIYHQNDMEAFNSADQLTKFYDQDAAVVKIGSALVKNKQGWVGFGFKLHRKLKVSEFAGIERICLPSEIFLFTSSSVEPYDTDIYGGLIEPDAFLGAENLFGSSFRGNGVQIGYHNVQDFSSTIKLICSIELLLANFDSKAIPTPWLATMKDVLPDLMPTANILWDENYRKKLVDT